MVKLKTIERKIKNGIQDDEITRDTYYENRDNLYSGGIIQYRDNSQETSLSNILTEWTKNKYSYKYVENGIEKYFTDKKINIDTFYSSFRVSNCLTDMNMEGILRFNYENLRFEICKNGSFTPVTSTITGNNGKSYFKRLLFSDNIKKDNLIINKGENFTDTGNLFKEVLVVKDTNYITKEFIDYDSSLQYSNPSIIYNSANLFDLCRHNIIFKPNDTSSYNVYVRNNGGWIQNENWSNHLDISKNLRDNSFYEYNFSKYFPFYKNKFSKMYINKLGYISFISGTKLDKSKSIIEFDSTQFTKETQSIYTDISCIGGSGSGATIDFTVSIDGYIDSSTIKINKGGSGYEKDDVITINGTDSKIAILEIDKNKSILDFDTIINGNQKFTSSLYTDISCIGGSGSGATIDFTVSIDGYIDSSTIKINKGGIGYKKDDVITINETDATIVVSKIREDKLEISYKKCLLDYRIAYFNGDLDFTYLSKAYVGLGLYNEIVITFINISINEKRQLANFQIRLWENCSETKTSRFSKKTDTYRKLYFSDDYFDEGTIQISYNVSTDNNILVNYNSVFVGLSGNIDYDTTTFKPLNFSKLINKQINLKNSKGIPNLETRLIFKSDYDLGSDYTKVGTNQYHAKIKTEDGGDFNWKTTYLEEDNTFKYYVSILDLGIIDSSKLPSHFFIAILSINDSKSIYTIGEIDDSMEDETEDETEYLEGLLSGGTSSSEASYISSSSSGSSSVADTNQKFYYSDSTTINNNFILQKDKKKQQMDIIFTKLTDNISFVSLNEINTPTNNNIYKDFKTVYESLTNQLYDSCIYSVQFKLMDIPDEEEANDPDESITSRKFNKISLSSKKKHWYMKIIYRLKSDDLPFNTSFEKAIIFKSIGIYGPYNIKKDYSNYYKVKLYNRKYIIELVHLLNNTKPSVGLALEIYDINKNIKCYSNTLSNNEAKGIFPKIEFDNTSVEEGTDFYLKVIGENNFYYFGLKMSISE